MFSGSAQAYPNRAQRSALPVSNQPSTERPQNGYILDGTRQWGQQQLLVDGHKQFLCCCSAGTRARQILRKGTPGFQNFSHHSCSLPSAGPGKGLGEAPALCQPPPWMGMARYECSRICSSLLASVARRTAGLAVSFSVLALAAHKARHTAEREAAECGCLARKARACFGALLCNMAAPAGGNGSAGGQPRAAYTILLLVVDRCNQGRKGPEDLP